MDERFEEYKKKVEYKSVLCQIHSIAIFSPFRPIIFSTALQTPRESCLHKSIRQLNKAGCRLLSEIVDEIFRRFLNDSLFDMLEAAACVIFSV